MCATVTPTILEFLKTKVNWANFGLKVKKMQVDEYGVAFIEWDNLAQLESIAIVLHRYRNDILPNEVLDILGEFKLPLNKCYSTFKYKL